MQLILFALYLQGIFTMPSCLIKEPSYAERTASTFCKLPKSPNGEIGPNFHIAAPPTFFDEFRYRAHELFPPCSCSMRHRYATVELNFTVALRRRI